MDDVLIGNAIAEEESTVAELANFSDLLLEADEILSPLESPQLLFYDAIIEYSPPQNE